MNAISAAKLSNTKVLVMLASSVALFGAATESARAGGPQPQCSDLDESYYGHWFNDTFGSFGAAVLGIQISGSVASFDVDMDGGVFGLFDPAPVSFAGTVAGDTVSIAASGLMTYGSINGTIICSTGAINATISMIPLVSFDDVTVSGTIVDDVISVAYAVNQTGMVFASGTMVVSPTGTPFSDFEIDAEDWRDVNNGGGGVTRPASGGNPGGFLQINDGQFFSDFAALAPGKFLGDLTQYDGGGFSFDARANSGAPSSTSFATVQITGAGNNVATLDFDSGLPPANTWTEYSMPLDAATWNVSQGVWDAILADTRMITITLDPATKGGSAGLDNVIIAPEPATGLASLAALATLSLLSARSRSSRGVYESAVGAAGSG